MTYEDDYYEQYQKLANAVVKLAAQDYAAALKKLRKYPDSYEAVHDVTSLEEFFCSQRFLLYTDLDGPTLMKGIRSMVKRQSNK